MPPTNGSIGIIDDDLAICDALRCLFESVHFHVKTYPNAQVFLDSHHPTQHGCLIIDVRMPVMSGLELLEHLDSQNNRIPVVMLTGYGDIAMAVRAMKLGAIDFVLKPLNAQYLLEVVQKCIDKSIYTNTIHDAHTRIKRLTKREHEVIHLILEGQLNKQIAHELSISMSTVEAHRASIMRKTEAKNLAQLIKFYLQFQQEYERV